MSCPMCVMSYLTWVAPPSCGGPGLAPFAAGRAPNNVSSSSSHLSQVLRRWALIDDDAIWIPACRPYDVDEGVAGWIVLRASGGAHVEPPCPPFIFLAADRRS